MKEKKKQLEPAHGVARQNGAAKPSSKGRRPELWTPRSSDFRGDASRVEGDRRMSPLRGFGNGVIGDGASSVLCILRERWVLFQRCMGVICERKQEKPKETEKSETGEK